VYKIPSFIPQLTRTFKQIIDPLSRILNAPILIVTNPGFGSMVIFPLTLITLLAIFKIQSPKPIALAIDPIATVINFPAIMEQSARPMPLIQMPITLIDLNPGPIIQYPLAIALVIPEVANISTVTRDSALQIETAVSILDPIFDAPLIHQQSICIMKACILVRLLAMEILALIFETSIFPVFFANPFPDIALISPTEFQVPIFEILPKPDPTFLVIRPTPHIPLMSRTFLALLSMLLTPSIRMLTGIFFIFVVLGTLAILEPLAKAANVIGTPIGEIYARVQI
jgi:hypothetical protein